MQDQSLVGFVDIDGRFEHVSLGRRVGIRSPLLRRGVCPCDLVRHGTLHRISHRPESPGFVAA